MQGKIFISYRREDSSWLTRLIYDKLLKDFSEEQLFIDVDSIAPGDDFVTYIEEAVKNCDVLLAVIGQKWLEIIQAKSGEIDFVSLEIAAALKNNIKVIPILAENTKMPSAKDLPDELKPLTRKNAFFVSLISFNSEIEMLIQNLKKSLLQNSTKLKEERRRIEEEMRFNKVRKKREGNQSKRLEKIKKFTKPVLLSLAGLLIILFFWKLVLPAFFNSKKTGTDTTTHSSLPDTTSTTMTITSLPPFLNEIWQSNSGKQLVNINIPQKHIYYLAGNTQYLEETIESIYKVDPRTYKINLTASEGNKVFLIKNATQQSFDLFVCDAKQANCSDSESMHLYYEPDTSFIYLPVTNNTANDLQTSEKDKLDKLINNSKDSFNINVFSSDRFITSSNVNSALNVLNSNGIRYTVAQQKTNSLDPFQRDYITIARKVPAPVVIVPNPVTYSPDCNRVFYSISQTKKLANPLIVCKLDLSKAAIKTIPPEVYRFTNLRELTLASNSISNQEITRLKSALPACNIKFVSTQIAGDNSGAVTKERSLGYLQFDDQNQLSDASKALLNRIAKYILQNKSAKITFLSTWTGDDQGQQIIKDHITAFTRYLQNAGIKSSNTQIASQISKAETGDVNRVNITGTNFPANF
jgi:hypothetical protein